MNGTLVIVDALNYLFRAYHALPPLTTKAGVPTGAVYGFSQMLLRIDREHRPTHVCVVFDAPGPTFREQLYEGYKANRPAAPADIVSQIGLAHEVAATFGFDVLAVPGVEADDVIASLARAATREGLAVVIGSSDKDLMQICTDHVRLLDAVKNRLMGPAEVKEKWGVLPEKLGDVLALMGDSIDCIPGVPGIGPKTAADLIGTWGSLDELLANVEKVKGKKGEAIAAARGKVELARQLVRLRDDVPLPKTIAELERQPLPVERLREMFQRLEFGRLLDQLGRADDAKAALEIAEAAASAVAAAPASVGDEVTARHVTDADALQALVAAVAAARECGLSILLDVESPTSGHLLGIAVALPSGERYFVPAKQHVLGATASLGDNEVLTALAPLLADGTIAKRVHDAKALEVFLHMRSLRLRGVADDTMLAGYVLDAASGDYSLAALARAELLPEVALRSLWQPKPRSGPAIIDLGDAAKYLPAEAAAVVSLAARQQQRLAVANQQSLYRDVELALVPVLAQMECIGIRLDGDYVRRLGNDVAISASALEGEIHGLSGGEFNIASPKQLAEVLFGKLQLPIVKKTKTGPSTDADVLEQLGALHPLPAKILEYRTLTKLKGTYIDALPALINPRTGRLHTTFHQAVAATGRLSSSDPNLQNIPIRSDIGRKIRDAFVADEGFTMVSADYSQIELRVLAHFCEDPAFVDAFASGADIHRRTAAEVFGVEEAEVNAEQRRIAKAINFGLAFGQTDFGLAQVLRIPRGQAHEYIERYFARYAKVRDYMTAAIAEARRAQSVSTLLGRTRALPEIVAKQPQTRGYAERIARNTPIQGSAADILKLAMIRVHRGLDRFPGIRLLLTVHDELVLEVPNAAVAEFCPWIKHEMEAAFTLKVPLVVDVHTGRSWGEAHA